MRTSLISLCIICSLIWDEYTCKTFFGQGPFGNLLLPGYVSTYAISTSLCPTVLCPSHFLYFLKSNILGILNATPGLGFHMLFTHKKIADLYFSMYMYGREHSGSVVECLTQDQRAVGSSLTGVTVLCP